MELIGYYSLSFSWNDWFKAALMVEHLGNRLEHQSSFPIITQSWQCQHCWQIWHFLVLILRDQFFQRIILMTGSEGCYCLNQASLTHNKGRAGEFPVGKTNSSQTATIVWWWWLNSPWAPGHIRGVSVMLMVVVVLLFLVLVQGITKVRDQSRALEDRNNSNNSLEVYTPNSFIHLSYNSPYMDVVDMHNILIIPSDSVLWA